MTVVGGFTVAGSGSAIVVTPATHGPGERYVVTLRSGSIRRVMSVIANRAGALHIDVPLGPSNPYQQYSAAAVAAGTKVYRTTVQIARAHGTVRHP